MNHALRHFGRSFGDAATVPSSTAAAVVPASAPLAPLAPLAPAGSAIDFKEVGLYIGLAWLGLKLVPKITKAALVWEGAWWVIRRNKRTAMYNQAKALAAQLGKQFVVIGAPDAAITSGYGCGDVTIDLYPSTCPNSLQLDITKPLPFADNSVVVFVSCVLEYVSDGKAAMTELRRIAGPNLFITRVEPWTLTALLFPGASGATLPCEGQDCVPVGSAGVFGEF